MVVMTRFTVTVRNEQGRKVETCEGFESERDARHEARIVMAGAEPGWTADVDTTGGARVCTVFAPE
jgi:hypothetical protein